MTEENEQKITITLPRINKWVTISVVLAVLLSLSLTGKLQLTGMTTLTSQQAANKAIDYINKNLVQTGTASLVSVVETSGVYKVTTSYQGQQIPVYVTKDGKYLFLSQPYDTAVEIPKEKEQPTEIPKREKATAELFVMAFCPYGVAAENAMKSVVDLLGTKADIRVHFIANVQGNTVDSVQSLHGINEAKEDLRQLCIAKNYDQKTFWNYLMDINKNCYSIYRDADKLDACWKQAAQKFGIDVTKIETCAYGNEGLNLLKAEEQLTEQYGVTGSPTLIINGVTYSGSRTSEAFKQAICSGFKVQPTECSQTLSTESSGSSGGC